MDLRALGLLVAGLAATLCGLPVAAETTRYGAIVHDDALAHVLTLDREITRATLRDFETALEAHQPSLLVLDSPGGRINAGLAMARAVRDAGLDTVVPQGAECASACAFLFIAGTRREARGRLGVHQFTSDLDRSEPINATEADTQDTVADILATLSDFDAPAELFVAMFATPNHSMHWFSRAELSDSGLTTGDRFDSDLNAWSKLRLASRDRERDEASDPADAPTTVAGLPARDAPRVVGPSFDCATATGATDRLVCADARLAMLDLALGARVDRLARQMTPMSAAKFRLEHLAWSMGRDDCGDDPLCLERAYSYRLKKLGY